MSRLDALQQRAALIMSALRAPESARRPLTIFVHTPSTGGTTMYGVLQAVYGEARTLRIRAESYGDNRKIATRVLAWQPFVYDALVAHTLLLDRPVVRWRDLRLLTLLRDPAQRVISNIYRVQNNPKHPFHAQIVAVANPVDAVLILRDNAHIRHLAGVTQEESVTRQHLETAKQRLAEWFTVAGITERYDESLLLMKRRLGWPVLPPIERRNIGSHRPRQVDETVLAAACERNALDVELYDFALAQFDRQVASEGESFQSDLAAWRKAGESA